MNATLKQIPPPKNRTKGSKQLASDAPAFGSDQTCFTLQEAAEVLGVSVATVRNWVRTGFLVVSPGGKIEQRDLAAVLNGYTASNRHHHNNYNSSKASRLTSRVNKSRKDYHDHETLIQHTLNSLQQSGVAEIADEYQAALSNSYRNHEGVYYTPDAVARDLFEEIAKLQDKENKTFCDPCCGSGVFVEQALQAGFLPENIYGYDVDPVAVEMTRKRIKELSGYDSPHILQKDYLSWALEHPDETFDCIGTNPPWGKKITLAQRRQLQSQLNARGCDDTSALFFYAALQQLKEHGLMAFLLPESFLNVSAFTQIRTQILSHSILRLQDYGKAFPALLTRAQGIVLKKSGLYSENPNTMCVSAGKRYLRKQSSFANNPKNIFNLHCTPDENKIIQHLYSIPHKTLKDNVTWGMGIVTGNNHHFCSNTPSSGRVPVYKGRDVHADGLDAPSIFISPDLNLYQQSAPEDLYLAREKIIYRFISSRIISYCDTKQRYFLNSANMLIPHESFPLNCKQLSALLNSSLLNWLFQKVFHTHKILRSDLETLPIHAGYFEHYSEFSNENYLKHLGLVYRAGRYELA